MVNTKELENIANILRRDSLEATSSAGSGHPSSCLSCAEIMSVLFFNEMKYDVKNAENPDNDEFILSKGHAAPILYSALFRAKAIDHHPLSLRKIKSPLEGHPIPSEHVPFVKAATGSLGQGLSIGVGMALAGKMQKRKFRVYVLLGDSECAEGEVYEAFELGAHYKLDNLVAIIDINRLGQRGETMLGHDINAYKERFESFGWNALTINGHDINEIINAFSKARKSGKPSVIIAKTLKGKDVSFLENKDGWHGRALNQEELQRALKEIPNREFPKFSVEMPKKIDAKIRRTEKIELTKYKLGEEIATREAYGNALANLAKTDSRIIAIDGEVSNSTYSEKVKKKTPKQFVEAFVAEQNMISMALGASKKGFNVFASSFAAFLSRAHDQIRMAALSKADITFCGSHAGVSIGEDGASQMGLEDIAMFRALPNSIILYPCDAVSTEKLVYLASKLKGIKYVRTTRPKTKVIYNKEEFEIGDFKILRQSKKDKAVLIGAGITLHECLKAHDELKRKGVETGVIDLYCIKPLNSDKLIKFVKEHGNKIIVVEDHYAQGGIGEALGLKLGNHGIDIKHLCIREIPHSGKKDELLDAYGISAKWIAEAAGN